MNKNLVISTRTIFVTLAVIVLLILLYEIRDVLIQLIVALILAFSIEPGVKALMKLKLPRWVAVSLIFVLTAVALILFGTVVLPLMVTQTTKLILNFPKFLDTLIPYPQLRESVNASLSQLSIASSFLTLSYSLFSNIVNIITVAIFSLYLSLDLPNVKKRFLMLFADDLKDEANKTWSDIELNMSYWIKGQIFLMLTVGLFSYAGLLLIGMPYAVPIAIIAGLMEVVPMLGPLISAVIASIVGFATDPVQGFLVVAVFIGVQQLENNVLVPRIMQKIIGFNPIVTMLALLIGFKLFGVEGALISIPLSLVAVIVFQRFISLDLK